MSPDGRPEALDRAHCGVDAPAPERLKRATELFVFEERGSDSRLVEKIWRTRSEPVGSFISVAVSHWEMVVTRQNGRARLTVRGPETVATRAEIPQNAEFFGIQFRLGTFMPALPVEQLVDGSMNLPEASAGAFWLHGSVWDFPDYDDAERFVDRLVRAGLLVHDPVVEAALRERPHVLSPRSLQRRVRSATGLTQTRIRQIGRANQAVALLERGASIADTVRQAGYADQAHLTRALKRFVGQTPGQLVRRAATE
jgi:AraC-like DNA-binding protein